MAENSKIQWTDHTFNPWVGCTKVSPGCAHCYAETLMDKRYGRVKFFVSGEPKGQPRPRAFARKMGNKFVARVYDAGTAEGWKAQIAIAAKHHLPAEPIAEPVFLGVTFFLPRPKNHRRSNGELKPTAPTWHTGKPDLDNYAKAVMDALTQIGMWQDDSQVVSMELRKGYDVGWRIGAMVQIEPIGQRKEMAA